MLELNLPNFITISLMSLLAWVGFNWAMAFMGWS